MLSLAILAVVALCGLAPSVAYAAADDDIPGLPAALGQAVEGVVDVTTDKHDVYAIFLAEGEEVNIGVTDNDPGYASSSVHVRLLPPGSLSVNSASRLVTVVSDDTKSYMPARSGTYYLDVTTLSHGMAYSLRVERSSTPAITTPDSDEIPGLSMGNGTWSGVVDVDADDDDVYAINLVSGQQVTVGVTDNHPGYASSSVYVRLLPPGSLSVNSANRLVTVVSDDTKSYMPAISGTYYLDVSTLSNGMAYTITLSGAGPAPVLPLFSDISASPYKSAIESLAGAGIIDGFSDGTFRPANLVTRQQFAKMIVLSLGQPVSESNICSFGDVDKSGPSSLYPDNYVAVAASTGITKGTSSTSFSPWANITRAQVITMVVRAAENLGKGALLTPPAGWQESLPSSDPTHGANIRKAEYNGLLSGIILSGWNIWGNASRGEVAQMLFNLRSEQAEDWLAMIENPKEFPAISFFASNYGVEVWAWLFNVEGAVSLTGYEWDLDGLHYFLGDTTDFTNEDPDEAYVIDGVVVFDDRGFGLQVTGDRPVEELEQAGYDVFGGLVWPRTYVFDGVSNPNSISKPGERETYRLHLVPANDWYNFAAIGFEAY